MKIFLIINALIMLAFAFLIAEKSKSAIHEILAVLLYLDSIASFIGYGILDRLDKIIGEEKKGK